MDIHLLKESKPLRINDTWHGRYKPSPTKSNVFPIVNDRDNWVIASNLKPITSVIVSVEYLYHPYNDFELFAYLSDNVIILSC